MTQTRSRTKLSVIRLRDSGRRKLKRKEAKATFKPTRTHSRKRTGEALQEYIRRLFADLPLQNPNPILRLSGDGTVLLANKASEPLLHDWGCKAGGKAPKFWRDLATETLASQLNRSIDVELGEKVYAFFLVPIADAGYVNFYGRDITERKRMEKELLKSEEKFRSIAERSIDSIFTIDAQGRLTYCSPATKRIIGYTHEELFGKPFLSFLPESEISKWTLLFNRLIDGENFEGVQTTVLKKDGLLAHVEINASPITKEGKVVGAQGILRDITERKRLEDELRKHAEHLEELVEERSAKLVESERRFRELADLLPQIVYETDESGNFTFLNKTGLKTMGYSEHDFETGITALQMFIPEDRDRARDSIRRRLTGEEFGADEYTALRKDGTTFPLIINSTPILRDGKTIGLRGIVIDVTERKRMEELLLQARRMETIGETAAMVGHDLRNPLQVIVNRLFLAEQATERLASPYSDVAKNLGLGELFKELGEQVKYMDKIVSDLQDYARPLRAKLVETSIHRLIEDTLSTINVPSNIKVSTQADEDIPKLLIDSNLMRRVFTNLITNAIQAMPNGGKLVIKATVSKNAFLISFQDTGEGIQDENMDKIWSPLFTTKPKGTGLGLPTCKRLVEAQNGTIMVQSKAGQGSTFTISIPMKKGGA